MKLFVIGNGFDRDHGLPTRYSDFKKFLSNKYGICNYLQYPEISVMPDGEEKSNIKTDAQIFYRLIDDISLDSSWSNFEELLGMIPYETLVDLSPNDDDDGIFRQIHTNEDLANDYSKSLAQIPSLFSDWIKSIDYSEMIYKEKYHILFQEGVFLTFNYTSVLEDVYHISPDRICHIHGKIGEQLVFGHADEQNAVNDNLMFGNGDILFNTIHRHLFKDTNACICHNIDFLNLIDDANEIYFLGWGMGHTDENYLNFIKSKIGRKPITIHFPQYDGKEEQKEDLKRKLSLLDGMNYTLGSFI